MKLVTQGNKLFLFAVVILFILGLNLVSSGLRGFFSDTTQPLQAGLWGGGNILSQAFSGIVNRGELQRFNELLAQESLLLHQQLRELEGVKAENEQLREALSLGVAEDFEFVGVEIIGKTLTEDMITVSFQEGDVIEEGMPVMTLSKVAVGKVESVYGKTATIRLLSHKDTSLDVELQGKGETGIVRGQGNMRLLLDRIPQEGDVEEGDMVVTSNLGGIFPKDLLVGLVEKVRKAGSSPFQGASVKWLFELKKTDLLLVLTKE